MSNLLKYCKNLYVAVVGVFIFACMRAPSDFVISDMKQKISSSELIIESKKYFNRNRNSAAIHINFSERWSLDNGKVIFENGSLASVEVVLIDDKGNQYSTNDYGMAGNSYFASFSYIGSMVHIVKVSVTSSVETSVDKIYWHCFDPI